MIKRERGYGEFSNERDTRIKQEVEEISRGEGDETFSGRKGGTS